MSNGVPLLKLVAGALFVLAGFSVHYGVRTALSIPIVLMITGGTIILIVLTGYRPKSGDIAFFVIGLLILGVVTSAPGLAGPRETVVYSVQSDQVDVDRIYITVDANFGAIGIDFDDGDVAYRIVFSRPLSFPFFQRDELDFSFSNQTRDGTLFLNASSFAAEIRVTLGKGYVTHIDASTTTGSISLSAPRSEVIESILLSTNMGSIDAEVSTENIKKLDIKTTTGSIDMKSDYLAPGAAKVPVTISTGTGSISFDAEIFRSTAVTLTAKVSIGSIHHDLEGFVISRSTGNRVEAVAGDPAKAGESFEIAISSGTGFIDLNADWSS